MSLTTPTEPDLTAGPAGRDELVIAPPTQQAAADLGEPAPPPPPKPPSSPRLLSLDAFRGLTVLLMLLVNNVALDNQTPQQLTHAQWNRGVNLADLVFPWFVFCVGVAMPFSSASARRKGLPSWRLDLKILQRGALLVLLGCLLSSALARTPIFELGILQTIGLAYVAGALVVELPKSRRLLMGAMILAVYGAALQWLPYPGRPVGALSESSNLVQYLNGAFLAPIHLKGLLSVAPMTALVLIGSVVGDFLRDRASDEYRRAVWTLILGMALLVPAYFVNQIQPLNKALWTPSYVLLSAGTGTLALAFGYLVIDVRGYRAWCYPLLVPGANAILAYLGPILVKLLILGVWRIPGASGKPQTLIDYFMSSSFSHFGRYAGGWIFTIGYVVACWLVLWQLYRKKVFLRV